MFKMQLNEIIEKIIEKSGLSEQEIKAKIDEKLNLLSGLISKEGAAHIIANELGIKLFDQLGGKLQIKNILAGMRDVETVGKVQRINSVNTFQRKDGSEGKVASLMIYDETGSIRVVLWGEQTDLVSKIKEGDVIKVMSGYVRDNQGFKEIHMNDRSKMLINPEGETVGVKGETSERKKIKDLTDRDIDVELLATIVQVFDIRFYEVCPQCKKRVRKKEENFHCEQHGDVTPDYSYVMNLVLDDGSETIRTVFFRDNVTDLLKMDQNGVLVFKDDLQKFDEIKNNLLGEQIKARGRVNKNEMFDRLEFVVNKVDPNPDPRAEIEKIKDAV